MGQPHKHAEIIKAWAEGAQIQQKSGGEWFDLFNTNLSTPLFESSSLEFRLKPQEPKNEWEQAVLDECITAYCGFYDKDPKRTLRELIDWHVKVNLDPQVSSAAQELVDYGRLLQIKETIEARRLERGKETIEAYDALF